MARRLTARGEAYSWLSYISTGFAEEFWTVFVETHVQGDIEKSPKVLGRARSEDYFQAIESVWKFRCAHFWRHGRGGGLRFAGAAYF